MATASDITADLKTVMTDALLQLQELVTADLTKEQELSSVVTLFLLGVMSTAVDLVEVSQPGSTPVMYADIEAAAKSGGLQSIYQAQVDNGSTHYCVSNIEPDDMPMAMNYLGQSLSTALFKGIHELPKPLRKPETLLRGVEALLANLLREKFDNPHEILDSLCEHVHMALTECHAGQH